MIYIGKQLEHEMTARLSLIYKGEMWGKKKKFVTEAINRMLSLDNEEIRSVLERAPLH